MMEFKLLKDIISTDSLKPKKMSDYIKNILQKSESLSDSKLGRSEFNSESDRKHYLPSGGMWEGEKGNSKWQPNLETVPDPENKKGGNPDGKTYEEIFDKHNIDGIEFNDGDPDFSPVSKAEVEIDNFTTDRSRNFPQADTKCAEQWNTEGKDGKSDWTARDIANFRKEESYTWHECSDCKTMQLVPKEVHNNVPHSGGISEMKKQTPSQ